MSENCGVVSDNTGGPRPGPPPGAPGTKVFTGACVDSVARGAGAGDGVERGVPSTAHSVTRQRKAAAGARRTQSQYVLSGRRLGHRTQRQHRQTGSRLRLHLRRPHRRQRRQHRQHRARSQDQVRREEQADVRLIHVEGTNSHYDEGRGERVGHIGVGAVPNEGRVPADAVARPQHGEGLGHLREDGVQGLLLAHQDGHRHPLQVLQRRRLPDGLQEGLPQGHRLALLQEDRDPVPAAEDVHHLRVRHPGRGARGGRAPRALQVHLRGGGAAAALLRLPARRHVDPEAAGEVGAARADHAGRRAGLQHGAQGGHQRGARHAGQHRGGQHPAAERTGLLRRHLLPHGAGHARAGRQAHQAQQGDGGHGVGARARPAARVRPAGLRQVRAARLAPRQAALQVNTATAPPRTYTTGSNFQRYHSH